jgi:hypothetical protein
MFCGIDHALDFAETVLFMNGTADQGMNLGQAWVEQRRCRHRAATNLWPLWTRSNFVLGWIETFL